MGLALFDKLKKTKKKATRMISSFVTFYQAAVSPSPPTPMSQNYAHLPNLYNCLSKFSFCTFPLNSPFCKACSFKTKLY